MTEDEDKLVLWNLEPILWNPSQSSGNIKLNPIRQMVYSQSVWTHPLYIYRGKRYAGRELFEPFFFKGIQRLHGKHRFYTLGNLQYGGTLIAWNEAEIQYQARSGNLAYDELGIRLIIGRKNGKKVKEVSGKTVRFKTKETKLMGDKANYISYSDDYDYDYNYDDDYDSLWLLGRAEL